MANQTASDKINAEVQHAEAHGFPPFQSETFASQLFWFALLFGALYIVMSRFALPRVAKVLETRSARIAGDLDTAAAMQKQADEAGRAYEKTLADAKAKAQATAQAAKDRLAAEADARRHTLESELSGKIGMAEKQIADMKAKAMGNVHAIAQDAAGAIIQQITGKLPGADALERAIAAVKAS